MTETTPRPNRLEEHPTVVHSCAKFQTPPPAVLDPTWLRALCPACGADDAGFVSLGRSEMDDQPADILAAFPAVQSTIAFACRMNREPVRSPPRSLTNLKFHHVGDMVTQVRRNIARTLEALDVRAMNEPAAFPVEQQDRWPGPWTIALKFIAVAAGPGEMGIYRKVIHPRFDSFILLSALIHRRLRLQGPPRLLVAFSNCFPSS